MHLLGHFAPNSRQNHPNSELGRFAAEPSHFLCHISLSFSHHMATYDSIQTGNIHIDEGERKMKDLSPLAKDRLLYEPRYPQCFKNPEKVCVRRHFLALTP